MLIKSLRRDTHDADAFGIRERLLNTARQCYYFFIPANSYRFVYSSCTRQTRTSVGALLLFLSSLARFPVNGEIFSSFAREEEKSRRGTKSPKSRHTARKAAGGGGARKAEERQRSPSFNGRISRTSRAGRLVVSSRLTHLPRPRAIASRVQGRPVYH